jgi:NADPH-dependent 2,4-dienoyl-CoA reductase/sulfur reductase-like enzyme
MKQLETDLAIIGAGPAGLAAALEGAKQGIKRVLLIERDDELGGVLNQCIHDGFGIIAFGKRLTGPQYAWHYIAEIAKLNQEKPGSISVKSDTMVLELHKDKSIVMVNEKDGIIYVKAGAVILAMGCRERTRNQVLIFGTRPAGVMTAGLAQRYINIDGYLPGKKAVILGSGDIGLIMARRMTLEGIEVEGVYEIMPRQNGLTRNIEQCLHDYNIPLHLSTTVTEIHGKKRVESVTVAKVDENLKPIAGTERTIPCDLLILSVGLIPENELSEKAGVEMDPRTKGPAVDENMMTSIPGIFGAGNVVTVFDLVDYVSATGRIAADGAALYLAGKLKTDGAYRSLKLGRNIASGIPQRLSSAAGSRDELDFYFRVKEKEAGTKTVLHWGNESAVIGKDRGVLPAEMVTGKIPGAKLGDGDLCLEVVGA